MSKKARKKHPAVEGTGAPTFYDFLRAVVFDRNAAARMLQENREWIRATNSLDETALHYLAVENQVEAVRYLLEKGAAVEGAQETGSPLTDAAKLGYVAMVALLIAHGANLESRDRSEKTPLLLAAEYGYAEVCDLLLAAGADRWVKDDFGVSILEIALPRKREQIASVLAKHGSPEGRETERS